MKNKIINILIIIISIVLLTLIGINLYQNYQKDKEEQLKPVIKHEEVIDKIEELPQTNYEEELNKLKESYNNNDIVGILSIENTKFSEIVMQSSDNNYYLEHTVYHEADWRGQTYLDYRSDINNSKKLIIYGHNSPNYVLPFKIFENYYDENYISDHKYMYLQTDKEIKVYQIFSVYIEVSDWEYYNKMTFRNNEEYYNHIQKLKNNSIYDTNIELTKDDEILIIQTCCTFKGCDMYENKFLIIIGKKI